MQGKLGIPQKFTLGTKSLTQKTYFYSLYYSYYKYYNDTGVGKHIQRYIHEGVRHTIKNMNQNTQENYSTEISNGNEE